MFKFGELKIVQIEITNRCQASCPMCPRNIHGGIENPSLPVNDWSLEDFVKIFPSDILTQIERLSFCGDFGDPLMNNDLIEMCRYVKLNSPGLIVDIHTNGSLRSSKWWAELVDALPKKHNVIFGIDGLEDTHHLYRIGTNFNWIIKNARAFINSGGKANWHMLVFKHNEHQVNACKDLSLELGFSNFSIKSDLALEYCDFEVPSVMPSASAIS